MIFYRHCFTLLFALVLPLFSSAQQKEHLDLESPFASFVETDFPFFTQTLDAREFGKGWPEKNLTSRGIILPLGEDHFACFDPDLLRWALIWKANKDGEYLTMDGMGPGSYRLPNRKASPGQGSLPKPIGEPLFASPLLPGWSIKSSPDNSDPREKSGADEDELSIGPIPVSIGRWSGLRLMENGVQLEYEIAGTPVLERLIAGKEGIVRSITIAPHDLDFWIRGGISGDSQKSDLHVKIPANKKEATSTVSLTASNISSDSADIPKKRWPENINTKVTAGKGDKAFTFDSIEIPDKNPWKRNVRFSDLQFFPDGRCALVTFDGDVWIAKAAKGNPDQWKWNRFASGLHEPLGLEIVEDSIYVFDRNGICKLVDKDQNGEADFYENFSNVVAQSAETREFAQGIVAKKGGGFFLAKGGQVGSTRGKLNGTVVEISKDGRSFEVISTGLRQPYIGYNPETEVLTASDQQGHWKPATPIYRIEKNRYFGFQPAKLKDKAKHPASIDAPEIWIPHFVNQSGASQIWLGESDQMGELNGSLIHIGYNRPEMFKVYLQENGNQGAVFPLLSGFPSGVLNGAVNPVDGLLYLCGFEIWGTSGADISGFFRVRPGEKKSWHPEKILAGKRGVMLTFREKLDPSAAKVLANYTADRWNYKQTHNYGSGNYKLDGEPGQEGLPVTSAYVSDDGKSLFLGIPDMQASHSLRVTYRIPHPDGGGIVENAYLTVKSLQKLDLEKEGFGKLEVNLTIDESMKRIGPKVKPTAELGIQVATQYGCIACHAAGDQVPASNLTGAAAAQVAVGPSWNGLWHSMRTFSDGSFIKSADETYFRESILDPSRRVTEGFETEKTGVGMPSYLGVLKDHEIDSILLYIKSLQKVKSKNKKK